MSEYVLEMNHISKSFPGVKALDGVSLKVRPGTVHALMGENGAGKSTLMKCLFGIYTPDEGEILLEGSKRKITSPSDALSQGISMIHQEAHPIRFRPVMENVWLGRFPMKGIAVDHHAMYEKTVELFKRVELDVDPRVNAGTLTSSTLQLMEIARAVSYDAKVVIMDEPTSSLTENETAHLFRIIERLKAEGRSVIYISHKMEEILTIADDVTIMRDGQYVGTWPAGELTTDLIIKRMVGRDMNHRFPPRQGKPSDEVVLEVKNLCGGGERSFKDVSFQLRRGEILGIGGLVGAKRTDLAEALFGLRPILSGEVIKDGHPLTLHSPRDAKKEGIALLTEERRANGIFGVLSVLDNTVVANQRAYAHLGVLNEKNRFEAANKSCGELNVKTPTLSTWIQNLSGGNQQKVLVARWLLTNSDVLILDEPTRGIDVGAKYEIYSIMLDQLAQGKSIIMISSEMPELLGMSDRVMVMCRGQVTGILEKDQFDQEEVMRLATELLR